MRMTGNFGYLRSIRMRLHCLQSYTMNFFKLIFFALLVSMGQLIAAQTNWPGYISQLEHDTSESTVAAVLPTDASVQAPASTVPSNKARWSGIWSGWGCQPRVCDIKLVVEKVTDGGATIIYAAASDSSELRERVQAAFTDDELIATLSTGTVLSFRIRSGSSGVMEFVGFNKGEVRIAGVLSQNEALAKMGALVPMPPLAKSVDRVPTPFVENDKPVTLEMVIYKPAGNGPFPALMFNHGSTGNGDNPAAFISTYTSAAIARYFTEKGWLVAFPQRRGRGKSDGLYDEGFEANRSQYSCDPQLSLPGLERALSDMDAAYSYLAARPDVDSKRLLIGGQSRGGIASSVYAATRPMRFVGVVNFVGGWVGDRCPSAAAINTVSFTRAAGFASPMLWLYGDNDPFYKISHSRQNFDAFQAAGGIGEFHVFNLGAGQSGHGLISMRSQWQSAVMRYLDHIQGK